MDPSVVTATNSDESSLVSPMIPSSSVTNANVGIETHLSGDTEGELTVSQVDYWRQMLADFQQLKLDDLPWLEPMKDAACQAESILLQILYPGIQTSDKATQLGTHQPPDLLDEVLHKMRGISHGSKMLIQLFQPFVQEIVEQEFGIFRRLSDCSALEVVLKMLKESLEKAVNMKKLSTKDVSLDKLLQDFKDVTKYWSLFRGDSLAEVVKKMAESIYNCKNSIGLLCMETSQSTMKESSTSTLQQGSMHRKHYFHAIHRLIYLADQLAVALANIKCSRDHLFDDIISSHLVKIMEMEKEAAPMLDSCSLGQYNNSRLKGFLKDVELLQQSYENWKVLERQKSIRAPFTNKYTASEYDLLDVVLQWDPFNSMSCIGHAVISVQILSRKDSGGSHRSYAQDVLQSASSSLKNFFHCLINANASFHNVNVIPTYSYADWHPSPYFYASSSMSSLSGEQHGSHLSSSSSSHSTSVSSHPINKTAPKIHQHDREPMYEKVKESDRGIFYHFTKAISNLKQLTDMLVNKNCGHILSKAFREAFQEAMEQKLLLLGFGQGARERLEKLGSMKASALSKRRRDWERAFMVVVNELLPWPKFLCDEIFSDTTYELKEACFYEYAKICLWQLLEFADADCTSMSSRAGITHQLYVHEVLSEISANVSVLFHGTKSTQQSFAGEVTAVIKRLEEAIRKALEDFRCQIQKDKSCIKENEVDVHQLMQRTMSYVKALSRHRITINSILYADVPFSDRKKTFLSDQSSYSSAGSINAYDCRKFMLLLFSCLETKFMQGSQYLKDSVAAQVFWINNLDYMIEKVRSSQLRNILGAEWVQEQNKKIQEYLTRYKDLFSAEVLFCLDASRSSAKRLNRFKLSVEKICNVRVSWKVHNPIRRHALRNSAWDVVVSVCAEHWYKLHPPNPKRRLLGFAQVPKICPENFIVEKKLEDLKCHLSHMFEG